MDKNKKTAILIIIVLTLFFAIALCLFLNYNKDNVDIAEQQKIRIIVGDVVYGEYTYEELVDFGLEKQLKLIDVLVDGKYIKELNTNDHKFRGSGNQRILKLKDGKICGE